MLLILSLILMVTASCRISPRPTSQSSIPTVVTLQPTPSPSPQPTGTSQATTGPSGPLLLPLSDYGTLQSGHTLRLPAGQWYEAGPAVRISQVDNLVIESDGAGYATLSRQTDDWPVLSLSDCRTVTFRKIRFGYERADWPPETAGSGISLVELLDCRDIYFEDCIFFGGAGNGLLLSGSENVSLTRCSSYNIAADPLVTGTAYLPSQIRCMDSTFESLGSGPLVLHLRDSRFDSCTWIGRHGYRFPVRAGQQQVSGPDWKEPRSLVTRLSGVLAMRLDYHSDGEQAITCRDNLFISDEVMPLFARMELAIPAVLPAPVLDWALSGQKAEEAEPGSTLDPVLGIRLAIRTTLTAPPTVTRPADETDPDPDAQSPYDAMRLLEALKPLAGLADALDPLIDGTAEFTLSDQYSQPLLHLALPVALIRESLQAANPGRLIQNSSLTLIQPALIPALFYDDATAGQLTARHTAALLRTALRLDPAPQLIYIDDEACFVEQRLQYWGTIRPDRPATHLFRVSLRWTPPLSLQEPDVEQTWASLAVRADQGTIFLADAAGHMQRQVWLPDEGQRTMVLQTVSSAIPVMVPGEGERMMTALSGWLPEGEEHTPMLLLQSGSGQMSVLTVLYDGQGRPWTVHLELEQAGDSWTITGSRVAGGLQLSP